MLVRFFVNLTTMRSFGKIEELPPSDWLASNSERAFK